MFFFMTVSVPSRVPPEETDLRPDERAIRIGEREGAARSGGARPFLRLT
jgi:hypothetical protein